MSSELIWELVKKHNCYISKSSLNGKTIFSKEPGNLYNKNSYKYSGLANRTKNVGVNEVDGAVALQTSKKGTKVNTTLVKKNARRTAFAAGAVAGSIRADLKKSAQARASALSRALRKRSALAASS